MKSVWNSLAVTCAAACVLGASTRVISAQGGAAGAPVAVAGTVAAASVAPPSGYVIGPEDQLSILFYNAKEMSGDVTVRPDGRISLPLLNEIQAAGLTPLEFRDRVTDAAKRFMQDPNTTIVVRQINSRKVFLMGAVEKPGSYSLGGPETVLQAIATAGGLKEYADSAKIMILRKAADGNTQTLPFNYKDIIARRDMKQNIELMPGDTIIVP